MAAPLGTGLFVSWDGGCIMLGRALGVTPMHSHYALQVAFGSQPGIRFRLTDDEPWTAYDAVAIASRQPHTMDASVVPFNVVLFIEPETREGRVLSERFRGTGITAIAESEIARARDALVAAAQRDRTAAAMLAAAHELVRDLTHGVLPLAVSDERILRATAYIRSHLDRPLSLEEVAAEAFLSPSRFRHLFVEQTGIGLRPYILWRRFIHAWERISAGDALSTAAHAAGFADAAHLTRTSRQMFGFPPSLLVTTDGLRQELAEGR